MRSGASKPELFIEREGLEDAVHVSLHESGSWHLKVRRKEIHRWLRPSELHPGYTRALLIVQPLAVATVTVSAPPGAVLSNLAAHAGDPMMFNLWIERPGANLVGWPGKNVMATKLVGRIGLAAGAGTCVVTSHVEAMGDASLTIPRPSEPELERMRKSAAAGTLHGTMVAETDEGTVCLIDGTFKPSMLV